MPPLSRRSRDGSPSAPAGHHHRQHQQRRQSTKHHHQKSTFQEIKNDSDERMVHRRQSRRSSTDQQPSTSRGAPSRSDDAPRHSHHRRRHPSLSTNNDVHGRSPSPPRRDTQRRSSSTTRPRSQGRASCDFNSSSNSCTRRKSKYTGSGAADHVDRLLAQAEELLGGHTPQDILSRNTKSSTSSLGPPCHKRSSSNSSRQTTRTSSRSKSRGSTRSNHSRGSTRSHHDHSTPSSSSGNKYPTPSSKNKKNDSRIENQHEYAERNVNRILSQIERVKERSRSRSKSRGKQERAGRGDETIMPIDNGEQQQQQDDLFWAAMHIPAPQKKLVSTPSTTSICSSGIFGGSSNNTTMTSPSSSTQGSSDVNIVVRRSSPFYSPPPPPPKNAGASSSLLSGASSSLLSRSRSTGNLYAVPPAPLGRTTGSVIGSQNGHGSPSGVTLPPPEQAQVLARHSPNRAYSKRYSTNDIPSRQQPPPPPPARRAAINGSGYGDRSPHSSSQFNASSQSLNVVPYTRSKSNDTSNGGRRSSATSMGPPRDQQRSKSNDRSNNGGMRSSPKACTNEARPNSKLLNLPFGKNKDKQQHRHHYQGNKSPTTTPIKEQDYYHDEPLPSSQQQQQLGNTSNVKKSKQQQLLQRRNSSREPTRSAPVSQMAYTDPYGDSGLYTGEVDSDSRPHGKGKMKYDNGIYYEGKWIHGTKDEIRFGLSDKQSTMGGAKATTTSEQGGANQTRERIMSGFTSWKGQKKNPKDGSADKGRQVFGMEWVDTAGLSGKYTGHVNEDEQPDGFGIMRYEFGLLAEGDWIRGKLNDGAGPGGAGTIAPGGGMTVAPGGGMSVAPGMSIAGGSGATVVSGLGMMSIGGGMGMGGFGAQQRMMPPNPYLAPSPMMPPNPYLAPAPQPMSTMSAAASWYQPVGGMPMGGGGGSVAASAYQQQQGMMMNMAGQQQHPQIMAAPQGPGVPTNISTTD